MLVKWAELLWLETDLTVIKVDSQPFRVKYIVVFSDIEQGIFTELTEL